MKVHLGVGERSMAVGRGDVSGRVGQLLYQRVDPLE